MLTAEFDLSRMNSLLAGIQDALIGNGEDPDARELVRQEAKLLAWECSRVLGPKNQAAGKKKIERDLKTVFGIMPKQVFGEDKAGGDSGVRWLYSGPAFLVGIKNEDYFPNAQEAAIENIYNQQGRGKSIRGNRSIDSGKRGRQNVKLLNRILIKRQRFNAFLAKLAGRVGRMRATFAYTANMLGMKKTPQWIARHFDSVKADGRAIFNQSKLSDKDHPSIEFGSRAPGIAHFREEIQEAIDIRGRKLKKRLELILNGYKKDHDSGSKPRRHAKDVHEEDES